MIQVVHRTVTRPGIELIKLFEGFQAQPYVCAGGFLTIGYGHRLLPSDRYVCVTPERAEVILLKDLLRIERAVLRYIDTELNDDQFTALVSFTFNLGPAALQRSTLRQKINYGDHAAAGDEFDKWVYAGGRKVMGLIRRRKVEKELFLSKC